jgi:NAD(P)-dependent dehydrogenase (short-subunit alcohol dehydrogenase family)
MKIAGSVALVTGANRGIGRQFVDELLSRGAVKVYVTARNPATLEIFAGIDSRIFPLALDVTDERQAYDVAKVANDVSLLINNAGVVHGLGQGVIGVASLDGARQEMEVNYFGMLSLSRAFAPVLAKSGGGAIVNVLSALSLVTMAGAVSYSASKAAALSATRGIRAELAAQGTHVVATMPVQVETDMGRALPEPRLSTREVVGETLDGVEQGVDEVFPGQLTQQTIAAFNADPKGVQAHMLRGV